MIVFSYAVLYLWGIDAYTFYREGFMLACVVSLQGIKDPMISWQIVVNHLRFNNCMVLERLNFRLNYQVFLHHKIFRLFSIIQWHHKIYITLIKNSFLLSGLYTSILEWWSKTVCKNCYIDIYFLMCIFDLSCWSFRHLYWSACANQCHNSQPCHGGDRKTFEVMTST